MFKRCSWQRKLGIVNKTLNCNATLVQLVINGDYSAPNQIAWCLNSIIIFYFVLIICICMDLFLQGFLFLFFFFCPEMSVTYLKLMINSRFWLLFLTELLLMRICLVLHLLDQFPSFSFVLFLYCFRDHHSLNLTLPRGKCQCQTTSVDSKWEGLAVKSMLLHVWLNFKIEKNTSFSSDFVADLS